jgi:hypothetical protein
MKREQIFVAIEEERERQEQKHPLPKKRKHNDAQVSAVTNVIISGEFLAVLIEEIGEVGKALQGEGDLQEELIQVASVCVRWLENL